MRKPSIARGTARLVCLCLSLALLLPVASAAPIIYGYQEGLAQATENGRWGFANPAGEMVIPIQYQSVLNFTLGTALVRSEGKMGLIRQDGTYLLPPKYDTLENLGYGLYLAQVGDLWGVVSILPFSSKLGGETQELYPITYDSIRITQVAGLDVLMLTENGVDTVVSLSQLPTLMAKQGIPSAQFPLIKGRLPSYSDVGNRDWFAVWTNIAYNVNLMQGVGSSTFAPQQTLTVAEALKLAAFMESQAKGDSFHLQPITGSPWYRSSIVYCEASGLIASGEFEDYHRPITRAEMAHIFAATTLARTMPQRNAIDRVRSSVPDVSAGDYAAEAIYSLYAKGVLSGTDSGLTFRPDASLTRAEAAAIVSRMARTEQRITLWSATSQIQMAAAVHEADQAAPLVETATNP